MISPTEIAWVAGIIEGEGCVWARPVRGYNHHQFGLQVAMTDWDVVRRLREVTGVGTLKPVATRMEHHKQQLLWSVFKHEDLAGLLMTVAPFLGGRRFAKVKEVLAIWRTQQKRSRRCPECHKFMHNGAECRPCGRKTTVAV